MKAPTKTYAVLLTLAAMIIGWFLGGWELLVQMLFDPPVPGQHYEGTFIPIEALEITVVLTVLSAIAWWRYFRRRREYGVFLAKQRELEAERLRKELAEGQSWPPPT